MINDMHQLCQFYVQREKVNNAYQEQNQKGESKEALNEYSSRFEEKRNYGSNSRNRSFSSFLSQQEAYNGFESFNLQNVKQAPKSNGRQQSLGNNLNNMTRGSQLSLHSLSSFCTVNELEKSMSYVERTAKKLLPILQEVKKRMIPDKKRLGDDSDNIDDDNIVVDL